MRLSPTSQLILQPFCCFTYVTAHITTLPLLHLLYRHFTYIKAHSKTITLLHLRHRHFTYVNWRGAHAPMMISKYPWWFCNLQWLWTAELYDRCKLALELKRLKTPTLEGMVNGKKVRGRRRYQVLDNVMINGLYEDTKRKAEKRVEWRMLSLQWKSFRVTMEFVLFKSYC